MIAFGIKNGMVMQRGSDDLCEIYIRGDGIPSCAEYGGKTSGKADITQCGDGLYCLKGIPTGGPYELTVGDEHFEDIYVGDVWILGGQSNMAGVGHTTFKDCSELGNEEVRAFYMTDEWDIANHPLHATGWAVDKVHTEVIGSGYPNYEACIGPGLSFGMRLRELMNAPQGLICCAHGGTSMAQWAEELAPLGGDKSLFGAMLRRFHVCGGNVRGMFWYQGCNDAGETEHIVFTEKVYSFFNACRDSFQKEIPIIQVQIGRVTNRTIPKHEEWWDSIQEQQRIMHENYSGIATLSVISKRLDDAIHLNSNSQRLLGKTAAEAMYALVFPNNREGYLLPPKLESVSLTRDGFNGWAVVKVKYKNIYGSLISDGRPHGFSVIEADGSEPTQFIHETILDGNTVLLYSDKLPEDLLGGRLYYGRGADPYCNITDEKLRDLPAMGPIVLTDIIE